MILPVQCRNRPRDACRISGTLPPSACCRSRSRGGSRLHVLLAVHQFFPDFCYGTEQYTLSLAQGLRELGHQVTLLTGHAHPGEPWGSAFTAYRHDDFLVLSLRAGLSRRASFADSYWREDLEPIYQSLLFELHPDVVHASHLIHLTPSFLAAASRTGLPLVVTLTDFWAVCWTGQLATSRLRRTCQGPDAGARNCVADFFDARVPTTRSAVLNALLATMRATPLGDRAFSALRALPSPLRERLVPELDALRERPRRLRACYELADRWIAPSQYLLDAYVGNGFARDRFRLVPYGLVPPTPEEERRLAERFGPRPAGQPLRFGYMGQVAAHKGVLELVRAFRAAELPAASLSIHGDPEQVPDYGRAIREAAAGDPRIVLAGRYPSEQFHSRLAEIDVLALPSVWHENAPFVLLGARATGTPLVVPRALGMLEFVSEDDAFVYPLGDEDGLRDALVRASLQRDLLLERPRAPLPRFAPLDCAHATLAVYDEVLALRRPVRHEPAADRLEFDLSPIDPPELEDVDALLALLSALRPAGFVIRIPGPEPGFASGLHLRTHGHRHLSLWSRRERGLALDRHPDFAAATQVDIVARANRGGPTLLRYGYLGPDGARVHGTLRLAFEKPGWNRLAISLCTARDRRRLDRLEWIPASWNARPPFKIDLLALRFRAPRAEAQQRTAPADTGAALAYPG